MNCMSGQDSISQKHSEMAAPTHGSAEHAEHLLSRRFAEETLPYPVWSEKLVGVSDSGMRAILTRWRRIAGRRMD
ncbi:hypothetical protein BS47DRAFT_1351278 [Hydnum rufescens UP504]|uniref:Uncharacterized protein n=1 Tax=Hydnum rufescens UP504 TaxID=1448309 RepID=A0A9P6DRJ7_9AGAM|nr:hypothetical protein BS47DRAFT_1351278 [Hydnum rufescens UP504]